MVIFLALALAPAAANAGDSEIADPNGEMTFSVNFRYPPTDAQIDYAKQALTKMSQILCDATEGQIRVREVRLTAGAAEEDRAAFWYFPNDFRSGGAWTPEAGPPLGTLGTAFFLDVDDQFDGAVLAHEMGHYAFGLGEQYDEQRRLGRACGIGRGFEVASITEENHSIMQQEDPIAVDTVAALRCIGSPNEGDRCRFDEECVPGSCEPRFFSEFSVLLNHDPIQSDGSLCPPSAPTTEIKFAGEVDRSALVFTFNGTNWDTARASSSTQLDVEVIDAGTGSLLVAPRLSFYATHSGFRTYTISATIDGGWVSQGPGDLYLLEQWELQFNADGSLRVISPTPAQLILTDLVSSAPNMTITLDFGTPNPLDVQGEGQDGVLYLVPPFGHPLAATPNGVPLPDCPDDCAERWNSGTQRWETSDQSLKHDGASDWETLVKYYDFLVAPVIPDATPPEGCDESPNYDEDVVGVDQVLLVMDKSLSMASSSLDGALEVCANGVDDDQNGTVDEPNCGAARIEFAKSAARAFADLQEEAGIDLGLLSFNDTPQMVHGVQPLFGGVDTFKVAVDGLVADGLTAIGSALVRAQLELNTVAPDGRSQAVFLMTDGFNTVGEFDPDAHIAALEEANIRVFTIPAGQGADVEGLTRVADGTGGKTLGASSLEELTEVYAELAAQYGGGGLILPRTPFSLFRETPKTPRGPSRHEPAESRFVLPVEEGADTLVVFVSGRNGNMATWGVHLELVNPDGERYDTSSAEFRVDPFYVFFRIKRPIPGNWILRAHAASPGLQESTALAFVKNPKPRLFADVRPRVVTAGGAVRITPTPLYVVPVEGATEVSATIRKPDGAINSVALTPPGPGESWGADFSDTGLRGTYEVVIHAVVGDGARPLRGEPIFDGPERFPVVVRPFSRFTSLAFEVVDGSPPDCDPNDCDGDTIPDEKECGEDTDGDGVPNFRDVDSDNDEISDRVEGLEDVDGDGVPDACDPNRPVRKPRPSSQIQRSIAEEELAVALICRGQSVEALKELRNSIRRVEQYTTEVEERRRWPSWLDWLPRLFGRGDRANVASDLAKSILAKKWEAYRLLLVGRLDCEAARDLIGPTIATEKALPAL